MLLSLLLKHLVVLRPVAVEHQHGALFRAYFLREPKSNTMVVRYCTRQHDGDHRETIDAAVNYECSRECSQTHLGESEQEAQTLRVLLVCVRVLHVI